MTSSNEKMGARFDVFDKQRNVSCRTHKENYEYIYITIYWPNRNEYQKKDPRERESDETDEKNNARITPHNSMVHIGHLQEQKT